MPEQMLQSHSIRPAQPGDAEALSRLAVRSFPEACPSHTSAADIAAYAAAELTPQRFAEHLEEYELLVVDDPARPGELAGYAMLCRLPIPIEVAVAGANPVELKRIYADPSVIGYGVGAQLMRESLARADADGHDLVWLGTNQLNQRAISFYQHFGFQIVGVRTFQVGGETESDYVLVRDSQTEAA
ncbi:MAG: GNAT family N-acetyltransferase [Candidatus Nanopelagicales bacterium]